MKTDVSRWIRHYRKLKGWTQGRLAQKCGTSPSYISHLELDDNGVSLATLLKISEALGEPIEAILYGPLEIRMRDDTHAKSYADGYKKAMEDMLAFCTTRIPTVMQTIHGAKGQRAFRNILKELVNNSEARHTFADLNGKAVIRVTSSGDVDGVM